MDPTTTCASSSPETCDPSQNGIIFYAATAFSTMGLSTILLMQLDGISRRILSPPRLLAYVFVLISCY